MIGLVEQEWLVTLATIEPEDVVFTDYVECARQLIPSLQVQYKLLYMCIYVYMYMLDVARQQACIRVVCK